jgi:hypothetical protein
MIDTLKIEQCVISLNHLVPTWGLKKRRKLYQMHNFDFLNHLYTPRADVRGGSLS